MYHKGLLGHFGTSCGKTTIIFGLSAKFQSENMSLVSAVPKKYFHIPQRVLSAISVRHVAKQPSYSASLQNSNIKTCHWCPLYQKQYFTSHKGSCRTLDTGEPGFSLSLPSSLSLSISLSLSTSVVSRPINE